MCFWVIAASLKCSTIFINTLRRFKDTKMCFNPFVTFIIGVHKHKCPFCPQRFTSHSSLEAHMAKHTGMKAYKCRYCPKKLCSSWSTDCSRKITHRRKTVLCKYIVALCLQHHLAMYFFSERCIWGQCCMKGSFIDRRSTY